MIDLFASFERGEGGIPKLPDAAEEAARGEPAMTEELVYRAYLWTCGIHDPAEQQSCWDAERRRRERRRQRADGPAVGRRARVARPKPSGR